MTTLLATQSTPVRVYITLVIGVLAASSAAILITFAIGAGVPTIVIAAGRLMLAALALTPFALARHWHELAALKRSDLMLGAASGFLLAIHFATWIASLEYTTILISTVLVTTIPLWVALLEFIVLRVQLNRYVLIGLVIAVASGIVIGVTGTPNADTSGSLLGAGLALAGAIAMACYLIIGRRLRVKLSLLPYIWLVYGGAAIFLVGLAIASGASFTGYPAEGYLMIVLLAIAPQLIGHTSFNYALKYMSATYVSITTQMEPIGSAIAAVILFQQVPTRDQLLGSVGILIGVLMATLGQRSASNPPPPDATEFTP